MTYPVSEDRLPQGWHRLAAWFRVNHRPLRLVGLVAGLAALFAWLPPTHRQALWTALQTHRALAVMLLVFSLLAISLVWSTGQKIDTWVFLVLNGYGPRPTWLDRLMLGFTQVGNGLTSLVLGLVLYFTGNQALALQLVLGTLSLWLVVEWLKFAVYRSRPYKRVAQARIVGVREIGRSFPSGHTSQAFFMAALLSQQAPGSAWVIPLLYAAALLVGLTRIYVGAHYPRDVLAGAILGSAWGLLSGILSFPG